jgi:RNA polymerase sigma-70 factor (ECF subfamily)
MVPEALTGKQWEDVRAALRNYGRRHFPALQSEIDDLVAQAVSDLWEYLAARDGWLQESEIRRIAYAIFKRRAADAFRGAAKDWALQLDALPEADQADERAIDASHSLLYRKMLRVCIAELANVSDEDDLLLSIVAGTGPDVHGGLEPKARQRLHRLRKRLTEAIRRELGEDAKALLRDEI